METVNRLIAAFGPWVLVVCGTVEFLITLDVINTCCWSPRKRDREAERRLGRSRMELIDRELAKRPPQSMAYFYRWMAFAMTQIVCGLAWLALR